MPIRSMLQPILVLPGQEGAGANGTLRPLEIPNLLHHFGGADPHTLRARQSVRQPHNGFFSEQALGVCIGIPLGGVDVVKLKLRAILASTFELLLVAPKPVDGLLF
jgi:hypothetical protein